MKNLVEIKHLSFARHQRLIFDDVSLSIPQGKITAIMGPSGTGKTTLLRLIGAQLQPNQGTIAVADKNIHRLNRRELYRLRKTIGMLFQSGGLFTHLNVYENVAFPLREHTTLPEGMVRTLVLTKLEMVGLRGASHLMPSELSGGMARRVALARAIALDPSLILYDEPLSGQDPISMGILTRLIRRLNDALNLTSIVVSHDVAETMQIADLIYVLANGKIIGQGSPAELQNDQSAQVRQFLDGSADGPVAFHYPAPTIHDDLLVRAT